MIPEITILCTVQLYFSYVQQAFQLWLFVWIPATGFPEMYLNATQKCLGMCVEPAKMASNCTGNDEEVFWCQRNQTKVPPTCEGNYTLVYLESSTFEYPWKTCSNMDTKTLVPDILDNVPWPRYLLLSLLGSFNILSIIFSVRASNVKRSFAKISQQAILKAF